MGVSREQFMAALGAEQSIVDVLSDRGYELEAEENWRKSLSTSPHGKPWHTSYHASNFPGDDPKACARESLYTLMGIPSPEPFNRFTISIMDLGKDIENRLVSRWHKLGILLSNPPTAKHQTGYEDKNTWLTGSPDAVILPPGWNRPHVVEVKTKSDQHVTEMRSGLRSYDENHKKQLLTYIYQSYEQSHILWPEYERVRDGSLYYVSRSDPTNTMEFYFEMDDEFFRAGEVKLLEWKEAYLQDILPPRPKDWKWTDQPCKWCKFKKHACKPDNKAGIEKLNESQGIGWAKEVYGDYDYKAVKDSVINRWRIK